MATKKPVPAKDAKKAPIKKAPVKKASVKKAPTKKDAPEKSARKTISANQKALLARLAEAVPQLDDECLEALVHSAENLAESCRQDLMLEEARMAQLKKSAPAKAGTKAAKGKKGQAEDANPITAAVGLPAPLTVEVSEDKRFFHIIVDGKWKMLDTAELKILVRIATDKGAESTLRTRMFTWLKRERSDVLSDLGISSAVSPILAELFAYLKTHFKVMT